MTPDQAELLLKARQSLAAARLLFDGGYPGFSASRAYYAMFYVAQAFLEGEQEAYSKHSAVIAAFGQRFALTGKVPVALHRLLIDAEQLRHAGDYGFGDDVTAEQAQRQLASAEQFLDVATKIIGSPSEADIP